MVLDVFPNPFDEYIQVNLNSVDVYYLTDLTGRLLNVSYDAATKRLETATLASGMYLLYVERDGKHTAKKLVKR